MRNDLTCRSGRHPISERIYSQGGYVDCRGCRLERDRAKYQRHGQWADPTPDPERAERLKLWQAGVDDAIAEMRAAEGFDGTVRTWTTLGECLLPDTALRTQMRQTEPERLRVVVPRLVGRCRICGAPRRDDGACMFCLTVLRSRRAS